MFSSSTSNTIQHPNNPPQIVRVLHTFYMFFATRRTHILSASSGSRGMENLMAKDREGGCVRRVVCVLCRLQCTWSCRLSGLTMQWNYNEHNPLHVRFTCSVLAQSCVGCRQCSSLCVCMALERHFIVGVLWVVKGAVKSSDHLLQCCHLRL